MKQFEYRAQCEGGTEIRGFLEAEDGDEAIRQLVALRLSNIDLHEAKPTHKSRSIGREDLIFFNEQLAALAKTGLCLDAGLRQLGKDVESPRLQRVLEAVAGDLERGLPLDQAVQNHTDHLPALYGRVVRAGVANGELPGTLLNLSRHLRFVAETRRLLAETLAYPAVILTLAVGMVSAIMILLVPQFETIFADFGRVLPTATQAFIALAHFVPHILSGLALLVLAALVIWFLLRLSPGGRRRRERMVLAIPLLGAVFRNSVRSRFLRAMSFAVNSGMPLPEAVRLSADATASPSLTADARHVAGLVEKGESIYAASQGLTLIPSMFGYVVEVNTDRNNLQEGLIQLSEAYESRARHCQSLLRGWLGPLAIVGVGIVIGMCIVALFMPLVSLLQSI